MRLRLITSSCLVATVLLVGGDPVAAGGGGCHKSGPVQPAAGTELTMAGFCFEPGVVTVAPGETVEIRNDDPVEHNVYGQGWMGGDVAPGSTLSRTFNEVGTYAFACTLHPGMTGAVVVGDVEPIAATAPAPDDDSSASVLLVGVGLALLAGLGAGWAFGLVTRHRGR
jgi:plastocyanin